MITKAQIAACLELLAVRRTTNGYCDLDDLAQAAGLMEHDISTEEGSAAKLRERLALHWAITDRDDVSFRATPTGDEYRLLR